MRVLVVGAGALGGVMGAKLTRAGVPVQVLDVNAEHVARMRDPGLQVNELGDEWVQSIDAVSDVSSLRGPFDFALITLKAPFLEDALAPLVAQGQVGTYVCLGNGLVQDRIAAMTGLDRLVIGTVSWGASNLGPGRVAKTTVAPVAIGEVGGGVTDRLRALADVMALISEVHITERIQGQVWAKLLLNSTFSGMGVVSGLLYAEAVALPHGKDVAFGLWTEGYDVACALGVELDDVAGIDPSHLVVRAPDDVPRARAALSDLMSRLGPTKASMLQDVERGAVTEVTVINGGVVTQAAKVGLPTPLNDRIVEIVHEFERGVAAPSPTFVADLAERMSQ